jgi:spermidine synthase
MEYVDVAEIVPGVVKGAPVLQKWNHNVQNNPKARIFDEDGRSLLFMSRKKYDIITSNAIHPRLSNNIYTRDFYQICKARLSDNGILCQWIPQNWLTENEYKSLLKAFTDVFPNSTLWYVNEYSTLAIGTNTPLSVSFDRIKKKFAETQIASELEEAGIRGPEWFLGQYWMSESQLREWVRDFPANTDNHPLVEFSRVISIEPNLAVMEQLAGMKTDYSRFFNPDSLSVNQETIQLVERVREFNKNSILGVIETVRQYRNQHQSETVN